MADYRVDARRQHDDSQGNLGLGLDWVMNERIYTRCPACHNDTLVINSGHLLCTWHTCPDPTLIDNAEAKLAAAEAELSALRQDSPTWPYVLAFAKRMEAKLAVNRHKGDREGWLKDEPWSLVERVLDETVEMQECFTIGSDGRVDFDDAEKLANECADVANFCMMVADCATVIDSARSQNK